MKVFVCRSFSGTLRATDETKPEWVEIAFLEQYKLLPNVKEIVMR